MRFLSAALALARGSAPRLAWFVALVVACVAAVFPSQAQQLGNSDVAGSSTGSTSSLAGGGIATSPGTSSGLGTGSVVGSTTQASGSAVSTTTSEAAGSVGSVTVTSSPGTISGLGTGSVGESTTQASGSAMFTTTIAAGGTFEGAGSVGSVTVTGGATLAPGSLATIGTLQVAGALVFAPGATYTIGATAVQADSTLVAGTATLGGTVTVTVGSGTFLPRTRYAIVTAGGGVSGSFAGVTTNLAFLTPTLSYDANDAYVNLSRNDVSFTAVAATGNQRSIGTALTNVGIRPTSDAGSAILNGLFVLSPTGARAAYDQLSGEGLVASQTTNIRAGRAFSETVNDQIGLWRVQPTAGAPLRELADLPSGAIAAPPLAAVRHYRVWASGDGGGFNINANAGLGTARQTGAFYGGDVGADTEITPGLLLGGSLGGSGTDFTVSQRAASGSAVGFHASIYGALTSGANYLQSITSFSDFSNTTNRTVGGFGGFALANERAAFGSTEVRERLEAGHSISRDAGFGTPEVRFTPFVALEIAQLASKGFSEYATNGASNLLGLQSSGQTVADVPGFLGVRIDGTTSLGGLAIRPVVSLAYLHEFSPQRNLTNGFLSLPGATFLVQGARPARNAAQIKLGAETSLNGHLSVFVNFEGEFSGEEQVYGGKGGLRYIW